MASRGTSRAMNLLTSTSWEPPATWNAMVVTGFKKAHLPLKSMVVSSAVAGGMLSFGADVMVVILSECSPGGPCKFLAGLGFSAGLFFIVCLGAELFTGNCMLVLAALERRISLREMLFDWTIVWLSNFVGAIIVQAIVYAGGTNGNAMDLTSYGETSCAVAVKKASLQPHEIFFRGVSANILVCIAVLIASAAKSIEGKMLGCALPVMVFVASGYEHSIANMCFFFMATLLGCGSGAAAMQGRYWSNLFLATLGNMCGAALLCLAYWITTVRPTTSTLQALAMKDVEGQSYDTQPKDDDQKARGLCLEDLVG
eukprot:TRINITY_DN26068_c0_g1_i1.p1 TRINITY_DN26068_c0_g1~~TRINITY_DN26068_c0_g1_i1.p1  ORF type:complete len:313 (+),score=56.10 TRINITY_DN26068_c0_g1_i1:118-1056(+)